MSERRPEVPPLRYRLLVRLLAPLLLVHLLVRAARDGGRRYALERLGFGTRRSGKGGASRNGDGGRNEAGTRPEIEPGTGSGTVLEAEGGHVAVDRGRRRASDGASTADDARPWVHAASVGEVMTALPLVDAILAAPDGPSSLLVTTNTPTGAAVLARHAPAGVRHRYLPIDWPGATRRFLERERPTSGRIVETEVWPWLFARVKSRGVPLAIVNARLSPRTLRHADGPLAPVYRRALAGVDVLARGERDAEGYRRLGAEATRVRVVGELKFAAGRAPSTVPVALVERPYALAASTHADEERRLAEAWLGVRPDGLLVIVPRHPERGTALARELPDTGRRSLGEIPAVEARLHLADTLGELDAWYAHAAGVFVGGSLIERGGHNVLEPARHGRPIVVGPHTANFADVVATLAAADAIDEAADADAVARFLSRALDGDAALRRQGERARRAAADAADVVERYVTALGRGATAAESD